jgi:hypothetical protein
MSIDADIYVILPVGARPIFRAGSIDPGATASTAQLTSALIRPASEFDLCVGA